MLNFTYYNPTKILFGKNQVVELDNLIPHESKVMITFGGNSAKKYGLLEKVQLEMKKSNRTIVEFGGIEPNPRFSTLMKAVDVVREQNIDFLLALGGGSVMDGTKFIAIAASANNYIGKEEELLTFGFTPVPVDEVLPLGTIVTLPATGSENNGFAVVSNGEDKLPVFSPLTYPQFSILDPEFTYTLPTTQVANGVVDAFVHVVEQYVTIPTEARVQDRIAEGVLQTLIEIGQQTIENKEDYDARANLVWSATTALNGHIGAGVPQDWTTHMLGHEITGLFGIDHGKTLAVLQPAVWKVRKSQKKDKLLQYAERVWAITDGDENSKIDSAIQKTEDFFRSLGLKTRLSEYDLGEQDLDTIVTKLEAHSMTALSEREDITPEISRKILQTAL